MFFIVAIISSVSCVSRIIGKALIHPNCLKRAAFHSITGRDASGPMFHRPNTAEPSDMIATVLALSV